MKTFEEWQADVYGGNITAEQANDELRLAYDYYLDTEKLRNENKGIRHRLSQMRGNKGICLEFDGKDMTDVYDLQKELAEKDIIINFLKKELMHKMSYRQVMKRQYRELKQQMEADNERHTKMYADLVGDNTNRQIAQNKEIKNLEKQLKIKDSLLNEYESRITALEVGIKIAIHQLYSGGSDSEMMNKCETVLRNLQK